MQNRAGHSRRKQGVTGTDHPNIHKGPASLAESLPRRAVEACMGNGRDLAAMLLKQSACAHRVSKPGRVKACPGD
jgi:hypothetical protein